MSLSGASASGQQTSAGSSSVVLSSDHGALPLPTGASTETTLGDVKTSVQLIDDAVATTASAIPSKGLAISGTDGTNARVIKTDTSGELQVDVLTLPALVAGSAVIGALTANQSVNNAQVNNANMVTSVTGIQDVMPRKRTSSTGLSPNYSANRITSKTTTTITASTVYVSAIVIACSGAGTSWTCVVQNKEGTPKILVPSFTLTVPTTGLPVILQFAEPILMTSGIDVVTAGTTAGTVDVYMVYWN